MTHFDIFNGDADGICALHQLRLHHPLQSQLITATKREINLVERAQIQSGDSLTVLDIALEKNSSAINDAIEAGASIEYFDHHFPGEIPQSERLVTHIDTSAEVCTSLIVNAHISGTFSAWAAVGAYGDNLIATADEMIKNLGYSPADRDQLYQLGTCINYNGYGSSIEDLHFHPADLYRALDGFKDPIDFARNSSEYQKLLGGFNEDIALAQKINPEIEKTSGALFLLPDMPWSRRVSGVFGNQLARDYPDRAHALLTILESGDYRISVRAPMNNKSGADELCLKFETGGGRKGAAGINKLPPAEYDRFIELFFEQFSH